MNHYNDLWVEKYRPKTLDDLILEEDIKNHFSSITEDTPHILFYGPAGIGKSTLTKILVKDILKCQYLYINASDENGIDTIRNKVISFAQTRSVDGKKKVVILEEADGLSGNSLGILRNVMEEYTDTTRFILTANYLNKILEPVRSRCLLFKLQPDLKGIVQRCVEILKKEKIQVEDNQRNLLLEHIEDCYPDIRKTLNNLQKFSITGKLIIKEYNYTTSLANEILNDLLNNISSISIRKKVIESEKSFDNDYQQLYQEFFEIVYSSPNISDNIKKIILLDIGEYMYRDSTVIDHEINFYCCILSIENSLKRKN